MNESECWDWSCRLLIVLGEFNQILNQWKMFSTAGQRCCTFFPRTLLGVVHLLQIKFASCGWDARIKLGASESPWPQKVPRSSLQPPPSSSTGLQEVFSPLPASTRTEPTLPPTLAAALFSPKWERIVSGSAGSGSRSRPGCSAAPSTEGTSGTTSAAAPLGTRHRTVETPGRP